MYFKTMSIHARAVVHTEEPSSVYYIVILKVP